VSKILYDLTEQYGEALARVTEQHRGRVTVDEALQATALACYSVYHITLTGNLPPNDAPFLVRFKDGVLTIGPRKNDPDPSSN
jgi:hypothetical protein